MIRSGGHRFPKDVILLAVRWHCRYPLSYRDVRDMLAERGIMVDAASIYRWVCKFGRESRKRTLSRHRSWRGLTWYVDETYIRVNGRWCYLWREVDQFGQLIDFRLTARRDAKTARAFLRQARETVRLYQPLPIITDKPPTYVKVIAEINDHLSLEDAVRHVTRNHLNNRIESDHAALKRLLRPMRSFRDLTSAKGALQAIKTFRAIRKAEFDGATKGVANEIAFVQNLFKIAA